MASYIRIASSIISWWLGARKEMIKERGAFFSGIKMIVLWRTISEPKTAAFHPRLNGFPLA
jgi:hypothetical protein